MIGTLFWGALALILFTYLLFPLVIVLRGWLRPKAFKKGNATKSVSILIAAYNEADAIVQRIENLLALDYPRAEFEIVVASDGSCDGTAAKTRRFADQGVKLLDLPRQGKSLALNAAAEAATGEILVFTDANTIFARDALRALIRPFWDPEVGGVAGNQVYLRDDTRSLTADGECWYWSFDRLLKESQSRAGSVVSATGAVYAIRRSLFRPIPVDATDDFMVSTGVVAQRRRLVFAADAVAYEPVAVQAEIEYGRKLRIITQGLRAVQLRRQLLNPRRYGFYAVQLLWHKILRRLMVIPLLVLLATSPWRWTSGLFYQAAAMTQAVFYVLSLTGFALSRTRLGRIRTLAVPFYFCLVNFAALVSLCNMFAGRRVRNWEPKRRAAGATLIYPRITRRITSASPQDFNR